MNEDVLDRDEKAPGNQGTDFRDKSGLTRKERHQELNQDDLSLELKPPYTNPAPKDSEPIS